MIYRGVIKRPIPLVIVEEAFCAVHIATSPTYFLPQVSNQLPPYSVNQKIDRGIEIILTTPNSFSITPYRNKLNGFVI